MTTWLKQSTAVEVKLGPFVDNTDGFTPETGLTISQADVRLAKNGGDWAQKNEATTMVHEENGWYRCLLNTTDTDTLGILKLAINEVGALLVWEDYMVLPANVYDSFLSTDLLQVDTREVGGTSQTAGDIMADTNDIQTRLPAALVGGRMDSSVGAIANNAITAASINADAITAAKVADGTIDAATFAAGAINAAAIAADAITAAKVADGTIDAATFAAGAINAAAIAADAITAAKVADGTIDAATFAASAITSTVIADNAITAAKINADAITAAKVADGTIDAATFAAGAINAAAIADNAIDAAALAGDLDTYQAKVWLFDDDFGTTDRYVVVYATNGQPITSGITSPTIQVIKAADGTNLIASTALTQIGALGLYRFDEATNRIVAGSAYIAKVVATIDGSSRTWYQPVGRDST